VTAGDPSGREHNPEIGDDKEPRRPRDSITDFGAVAFLFGLFFLAIGLMYLIGPGRG
jgi:hypothetical protein